jgi:hypothetical protein
MSVQKLKALMYKKRRENLTKYIISKTKLEKKNKNQTKLYNNK